ncbi:MAG: hypothetical protein KGM47_01425 [Acidobacteriota bacterium]|nr:hypothetical protein [Acidobacteriota bacterium]
MYEAILILIVSTALLLFYLQATCQKILRRRAHEEYYHSIVNANRLEFPYVRSAIVDYDAPLDYRRFRMQLKCDYLALAYLMRNALNAKQQLSRDERILVLYTHALFSLLSVFHVVGIGEKAVMLRLTAILQYFSNVLGERVSKIRFGNMTASEYLLSL